VLTTSLQTFSMDGYVLKFDDNNNGCDVKSFVQLIHNKY